MDWRVELATVREAIEKKAKSSALSLEDASREIQCRAIIWMVTGRRIVVVLEMIKERGRQINYGTGKDVSDESIADAKRPLEIKWYNDSYIDLPVWNWKA